jgi:hypothetical protein
MVVKKWKQLFGKKINHLAPQIFDTNVPCHIYRPAQNTGGLNRSKGYNPL